MRFILGTVAAAAALCGAGVSHAQGSAPIKVGLMLPYTGTFAALGNMIEKGFRLHVQEQGGKLAGREIQYFKVDDESDPAKATDNANKLIKRDQVDVLVGTVHSGVALAMAKVAKESKTLLDRPERGCRRDHRAGLRDRTSSAPRSRTGSPAMRPASSPRRRATSAR